ncbi:uncharacterized protein V1516DRAFT_629111 [Lipomyces oligophaga]|uniref:uncharacterized protein n=1 Tax=Lipomyces oligophaga TaxID=45792 RepID=UPI0034CE3C18
MISRHPITCHVLDTTSGKPAQNVQVLLQIATSFPASSTESYDQDYVYSTVATASTNSDGRVSHWSLVDDELSTAPINISDDRFIAAMQHKLTSTQVPWIVRVRFKNIAEYFANDTFFPYADIVFTVPVGSLANGEHFHIPLLLSKYSYTTYRGS